jgi:hypothetical protein
MMPEKLISKRVDDRQLAPSFTDQEARGLIYTTGSARLDVGPAAGGSMLTPAHASVMI